MTINNNEDNTIFSIKSLEKQPLCVGSNCSFENQFKAQKRHLEQVRLNLIKLASKKLEMRENRTFCYWLRSSNMSLSIDFFNIDEEFIDTEIYDEILKLFKEYTYNNPRADMRPLHITPNRTYLKISNLNKYKLLYLKEELLRIYFRELSENRTHYIKRGGF